MQRNNTNFNKSGRKGGDISVSADVLAVERETVVDHGHDQPREEDVEGSLPHLRGLDQHDQLLEDLVDLLLLRLRKVGMVLDLLFLYNNKKNWYQRSNLT